MDRCDVSGQLRLNGNYYFQAWNISQHWPESQCTYEVCSLVCTWIEERATELLTQTEHYENEYEAALYMIGLAVDDLHARRIIHLTSA
jgi:hypothetical protein